MLACRTFFEEKLLPAIIFGKTSEIFHFLMMSFGKLLLEMHDMCIPFPLYPKAIEYAGGFLIGRTLAVLITMTLATSMAAREGPVPMAGYQICTEVWLALSMLTDALAIAGQVLRLLSGHIFYFGIYAFRLR